MIARLLRLPIPGASSRVPRNLVWAVQILIFVLSGWAAFLLRFDLRIPPDTAGELGVALVVWITVKSAIFRVAHLDRGWWRYFSSHDAMRLCRAAALGSALSVLGIVLVIPSGFPRSVYVLDFLMCTLLSAAIRLAVRAVAERKQTGKPATERTPVVIYGAGSAGQMLVRELRSSARSPHDVAGFIDDDLSKHGLAPVGVRVLGGGADLASLVRERSVAEVLIAVPGARPDQMSRILAHCRMAGVPCKTVPSLAEIMSGARSAAAMRQVPVEDLLGRPPNCLDEERIRRQVAGQVVLITGAAGSIGSELCRQLARFAPQIIVGFDIAESGLFHLDRELAEAHPGMAFRPEVGSIQNRTRLDEVLAKYRPGVVYHAAAYKHVPLMEAHAFEAIENNVLGTLELAEAAADHGVATFVMISSDKAVRPANIMGASKRLAEMVVHAMGQRGTRFVSVRFGNVLGSNGSVVPIFKQQIARGGPVCVTHPEMRRYFMTIPEAVQLVLQASTMGSGGEVFVLDMGEPVKIVDLARNLIRLTGLRPDEDIRIEFTGLRPGEKLFEELHRSEETTLPTAHGQIRVFTGENPVWPQLAPGLERLRGLCRSRDAHRLVLTIMELVPDYSPDPRLLRQVGVEQDLARLATHVGFTGPVLQPLGQTLPQA